MKSRGTAVSDGMFVGDTDDERFLAFERRAGDLGNYELRGE
jgi:hypothetical protein